MLLLRRTHRRPQAGRQRVIINADDFGRSAEINEAVVEAHRCGVLTSASLMVTGEAAEEAAALARQTPTLSVGLHVVLVDGRSALSRAEIPHLVDAEGRFPKSPLRAGLRYAFNRPARVELDRELQAQFERFAATGLHLSHVDGHLHMHLHPVVLRRLLPLAVEHGARGIRVPRDRLGPALRRDRRRLVTKLARAAVFAPLSRWSARTIGRHGLSVAARTYGLMQTGEMEEAYVVDILRRLDEPVAELYFHPTTGDRLDLLGPNPGDYHALISPAVRGVIQQRHLQLASYPMLNKP